MADCLISNWKGKSTETLYENEIRKNTGDLLDRLLVFFDSITYLLRSFSSVFERVFMVTSRKWRAAEMRNKVRNMLLCFPQLRRYFDEGERAEDCSELPTKTRKETKTSMLHRKKKDPEPRFLVVSPNNFRRVVGFPPTVNQHYTKST